MADKFELDIDQMEDVAGGAGNNLEQTNKNIKSTQQNNQNGNNINELTQINDVHNNTGDVTIKSPINLKGAKNVTINL